MKKRNIMPEEKLRAMRCELRASGTTKLAARGSQLVASYATHNLVIEAVMSTSLLKLSGLVIKQFAPNAYEVCLSELAEEVVSTTIGICLKF